MSIRQVKDSIEKETNKTLPVIIEYKEDKELKDLLLEIFIQETIKKLEASYTEGE